MSDELLAAVPRVAELNNQERLLIQAGQVPQADAQLATPSEEQIRSADGVFTQHTTDDDLTAVLGVTTGILILHDMAVDRFTTHEKDEEKPEPREKPEKE
jgi:hypothetical protein